MPHRYVSLPFAAVGFLETSPTRVRVAANKVAADVDLRTGLVVSAGAIGSFSRQRPVDASISMNVLRPQSVETSSGPFTTLTTSSGVNRLEGQLTHGWLNGGYVVGVFEVLDDRWECVAFVDGVDTSMLRLPATRQAPVTGDGNLAVCVTNSIVHLFRFESNRLRSVSVPISSPGISDDLGVYVTGSLVCVLTAKTLFLIDTDDLAFTDTHQTLALTYQPFAPSGAGDAQPAKVVMVLPESILLDHPKFQRLRVARVPGQPAVVKGDEVLLDDVRETLPGVFQVVAWHTGKGQSVRPVAPPLELPAPLLQNPSHISTPTVPDAPRESLSRMLRDLAERHRFSPPRLLTRLLETRDADPVFRRWLDKIGLIDWGISGLADWGGDPHLLAFFSLGNGDEHALYLYPPWCAEGNEPPVVEFFHETNEVEFRARTFRAYFLSQLDECIDWAGENADEVTELVRMVRERLDLGDGDFYAGDSFPWLTLNNPPRPSPPAPPKGMWGSIKGVFSTPPPPVVRSALNDARELERSGNVHGAERAFLAIYLQGDEDGRAASLELRRIYTALGWTWALGNLE